MKIFLALCLIGTVFASYKAPTIKMVEFRKDSFAVIDQKIDAIQAHILAKLQPECGKNDCRRKFSDFGYKQCVLRKPAVKRSGYRAPAPAPAPGSDGYVNPHRSGYSAPASGPDGYANPQPNSYSASASGPDGYANPQPNSYSAPVSGPDGYANSRLSGQGASSGSSGSSYNPHQPVETIEKCEGDDCRWWVKEAHSKCFGKVQLYKTFGVCGVECGPGEKGEHGEKQTYSLTCGSYKYGKAECSCDTVFCVNYITTAFFEDYRAGYSTYDDKLDKDRVIRKGQLRYKYPCKCSCRA